MPQPLPAVVTLALTSLLGRFLQNRAHPCEAAPKPQVHVSDFPQHSSRLCTQHHDEIRHTTLDWTCPLHTRLPLQTVFGVRDHDLSYSHHLNPAHSKD